MQLDRPFLAITPTVDGDVLAALARVNTSMSVSQLQRVIDRHSLEGIRKVVNRLVQQGIVTVEYVGTTGAYRFNRDHLLADAVVAINDAKSRLLARLEAELSDWPDTVKYVALFGSGARGEMRSDSDLDLLVVHDDDAVYPTWESAANDLAQAVYRWTGNSLSTVSMQVAELQRRWRDDDGLVRSIRDEGLTVRGTRDWLEARLREAGRYANA